MPKPKSVLKRIRQNKKRRAENKSKKSRMRTLIKKFLKTEDKKEAQNLLPSVQSVIDRSVQNGIIHRNTGVRYKKKLHQHLASLP